MVKFCFFSFRESIMEDDETDDNFVVCLLCGTSKPIKSILLHVVRSKKCKQYYETHDELEKLRKRCHTANRLKKNRKRRLNYDPNAKSEENKRDYEQHKGQRTKSKRSKRDELLNQMDPAAFDPKNEIFQKFFQECHLGPIFPCICCKRCLSFRGVKTFQKKFHDTLIKHGNDKFIDLSDELKINGQLYICHCCHDNLTKTKMPNLCYKNGLDLSKVPKCLQISDVGNQLLAKHLIFLKIRKLPKTGMPSMNDRVRISSTEKIDWIFHRYLQF